MKIALAAILLILAVLASGCTIGAPIKNPDTVGRHATPAATRVPVAAAPRGQAMGLFRPNLTGTWTGEMKGYEEDNGFMDYDDMTISMVVTEQHGQIFSGRLRFTSNESEETKEFAGAIGRDNVTLSIVEKGGGSSSGTFLAKDRIELLYVDDTPPYRIAVDTLRKEPV
jgi:hypothetical protein